MTPERDATRPHVITLAATLRRDTGAPLAVTAPAAGRVAEVFVRAGAGVARDEPVLRLVDLATEGLTTVETTMIETAPGRAGVLVTTPSAGLVLDPMPAGLLVAAGTVLFRVLGGAAVDVAVPEHHGALDRESIVAYTVRCGAAPWPATLRDLAEHGAGRRLHLALVDPDGRLPVGASVTVELTVVPSAAMREAEYARRRAARLYSLPPRGLERRYLGLSSPVTARTVPPSATPVVRIDPTRRFAPRRPKREPASFVPPGSLAHHAAPTHRATLALSPDAWKALGPATDVARPAAVHDHVDVVARVERVPANPQAFRVTAPAAGTVRLAPGLGPGDPLAPGQPLGTLAVTSELLAAQRAYLDALAAGDAGIISSLQAHLEALGLSAAHRSTLARRRSPLAELALVAPLHGVVETVAIASDATVAPGATLLTLAPANTTFAVLELEPGAFARLPPLVEARWCGDAAYHATALPLLEVHTATSHWGAACVRARLPLPAALADGVPLLGPKLRLADPATQREAVLVPSDCVVMVGRSAEVVLHVGPGQLRALSVARGLTADGLVEILDGVRVGDAVVRDAAFLADEDPRVRALLAGFWDPAPRPRAPRSERRFNPLLDEATGSPPGRL